MMGEKCMFQMQHHRCIYLDNLPKIVKIYISPEAGPDHFDHSVLLFFGHLYVAGETETA